MGRIFLGGGVSTDERRALSVKHPRLLYLHAWEYPFPPCRLRPIASGVIIGSERLSEFFRLRTRRCLLGRRSGTVPLLRSSSPRTRPWTPLITCTTSTLPINKPLSRGFFPYFRACGMVLSDCSGPTPWSGWAPCHALCIHRHINVSSRIKGIGGVWKFPFPASACCFPPSKPHAHTCRWDSLEPEQRKAVMIGGGGLFGLLLLRKLLFGRNSRGHQYEESDLHGSGHSAVRTPARRGKGSEIPVFDRAAALQTDPANGEFSVMTYNTLAGELGGAVRPGRRCPGPDQAPASAADIYATAKRYPYVFSRYLQWDYRYQLLQAEIRATNADVVCLQEIDPNK